MDETEREVYKLHTEFNALVEALRERQARNDERIAELEKTVADLKNDRAKLSGGIIFITAVGGVILWIVSFGQSILRSMGKS